MKSLFFQRHDPRDWPQADQFRNHLGGLSDLPDASLGDLALASVEFLLARTKQREEDVIVRTAKDLGQPAITVAQALRIGAQFLQSFHDMRWALADNPGDLAEDLIEYGFLRREVAGKFARYIGHVRDDAFPIFDVRERRREASSDGVPVLSGSQIVVDFRPVFSESFEFYADVDKYKPSCVGLVPVLILDLKLTGASVPRVQFQVDEEQAIDLIRRVKAALKQLDVASEYIGLESKSMALTEARRPEAQ